MTEDKQLEVVDRGSRTDIQSWKLNRDVLVEAAKEVGRIHRITFNPEDYYDSKQLRYGVEETLGDPMFGHFCVAYEKKLEFRKKNPEMYEEIQKMGESIEDGMKILKEVKDNPLYKEYVEIDAEMVLAQLKLSTSGAGRIHLVAATYARLANIIFPETL